MLLATYAILMLLYTLIHNAMSLRHYTPAICAIVTLFIRYAECHIIAAA